MSILLRALSTLVVISFLFFGCNSGKPEDGFLSGVMQITPNEDKAIKEIIAFYGGRCEYGFEKRINLNGPNQSVFWLKFSQSAYMDSLQGIADLPVSNMAYLLYKNLTEKEKRYSTIKSEVTFSNGRSVSHEYTLKELQTVKFRMRIVDTLVDRIAHKQFDDIKNFITVDTTLFPYDIDQLIDNLKTFDPQFGNVTEFVPFGFKFHTVDGGRQVLHIAGMLLRDKQHNEFGVDLDPNSADFKIYFLAYKL